MPGSCAVADRKDYIVNGSAGGQIELEALFETELVIMRA
jgi:hypothetical protein